MSESKPEQTQDIPAEDAAAPADAAGTQVTTPRTTGGDPKNKEKSGGGKGKHELLLFRRPGAAAASPSHPLRSGGRPRFPR